MKSEWKIQQLSNIVEFNPKETLKKGVIAKKISMDKLQPFCRDICEYELTKFTGGTKFRNGDTIMARITPCLENGKTAKINILNNGEIGFGSTEYIVFRAKEGISDQDKKISSIVTEAGKGLIVAINKWDLIDDKNSTTINKFEKELSSDIPFLSFAPKIFISAVTKQRLGQIFDKSIEVYEQCIKRVSTGLLNKVINEAYALNPPTSFKGKRLKIYYTTQAKTQPPTFILFVNNEELLKDSYKRYIENKLREAFGFFGTPIRISVRARGEKKTKGK